MRKVYLILVLPLLMLLAQQGAAWHEIAHLGGGHAQTAQSAQSEDEAPYPLCDACLSFAHLDAAAPSVFHTVALQAFSHALSAPPAFSVLAAQAPAPRSRGPPRIL